MSRVGAVVSAVMLTTALSTPASTQAPRLAVLGGHPNGALTRTGDAAELRIAFSEPMVALGGVDLERAPAWLTIEPAIRAAYYWSGTRTLIVTPDPDAPLPRSTRFVVRIGVSAESVNGRVLGAPHEFAFTTPTARLESVEWYRRGGRFDAPAVLALRFSQPVRPADVLAHTSVRNAPHTADWREPAMSPAARRWLGARDPEGLAAFDAKVAAARRVVSSSDPVPVALAAAWNDERFPPEANLVVLETVTAPLPDAWLAVSIDEGLPGLEGPATHPAQTTVVRLEPTLFVDDPRCTSRCDPDASAVARLRGRVALDGLWRAFNVLALDGDRESAIEREDEPPQPDATAPRDYLTAENLGFPAQPPLSRRLMLLDASLEAEDGQRLGYRWAAVIDTVHRRPFIGFGGNVWEASNGSVVPLTLRNVATAAESIGRLAPEGILSRLQAIREGVIVQRARRDRSVDVIVTLDEFQVHGIDLSSQLSRSGTGVLLTNLHAARLAPDTLRPGRGAFELAAVDVLQITNLALTVKTTVNGTLAFVSDLGTGAPVAGADVSIISEANEVIWRGPTDAGGVAAAPVALPRQPFVVTAANGEDLAFVSWLDGLSERRRPVPLATGPLGWKGAVFTDRGAYRQGETVTFKSFLRAHTPEGLGLLDERAEVHVEIADSRRQVVERRVLRAGPWSSVEDTWSIPDQAPLGEYTVRVGRQVSRGDSTLLQGWGGRFLVAAFRPPDFRVDASIGPDDAILGDVLTATVEARYLFGSPVAGRPVRAPVQRTAVLATPRAIRERYPERQFAFGYRPSLVVTPGDRSVRRATLDADGRFVLEVDTRPDSDAAWRYSFSPEVASVASQVIADHASLDVHPASLYPGIEHPAGFISATDGADVRIHAVSLDGEARAGRTVRVSLVREEWVRTDERRITRNWEVREVPAGDWTLEAATNGAPLHVPVPTGGSYVLRALASDADGRTARTDWRFFALGPGASWRMSDEYLIDVVPERETWRPGETARLLVQSPWENATALVTVEREGVRHRERVAIASRAATVAVPITEADVPNVVVSVVLSKGRTTESPQADDPDPGRPAVRLGQARLLVDTASRRLQVDVQADRETYGPGDDAQISVEVRSQGGAPAQSDVTLWAVDHGLLSLTAYETPDLVEAIYSNWPTYVSTYDNRRRVISRAAEQPRVLTVVQGASFQAGFGGRGVAQSIAPPPAPSTQAPPQPGAAVDQEIEPRVDFRPLVFWLGSVETDANGRATATATLPDSLTTYRIMAVAADRESRFGAAEHEVRATKPLAMLPAFPRFLAQGDEGSFGVTVTSAGAGAGDATVTIRSLDPTLLAFDNGATRTLAVAAGETVPVTFDGRALGRGTARVRVSVALGGETDALDWTIPIVQPLRRVVSAAYGDTLDRAVERLELPPGAATGNGLTIDLASTALVGLGEGARYLNEYPYECAEQKASRALAMLLDAEVPGAFGLTAGAPDELRARAESAVNELWAFHCGGSGGFSLWPGQCGRTSVYLTAYILHVLHVAGVQPAQDYRVQSALRYLETQLMQPPPEIQWWPAWAASQAFSVKVLAEMGRRPSEHIDRLVGAADRMPVFALSYLADALAATGRGARYRAVVEMIANATRVEADRAFVQELESPSLIWLWNSNVRATAAVLEGLARRGDDGALAAPMARWLLAARENGRWRTTHENGSALEALVAYFRAMEPVEPDMTATVTLGATTAGVETFAGRSDTTRSLRIDLPDLATRLGPDRSTDLAIEKAGDGRLYYTARLDYLEPMPADPEMRGIRIERQYERFVPDAPGEAASSFALGDVVRVRLVLTLPREGRFLAVTDALPAGFEAVDAAFATTAADLAREATTQSASGDLLHWWRNGGFDHVEKHDDRVVAFATRLAPGRHEFTYLARATTAGEFTAAGATAEAMYAPEVTGRSAQSRVVVR
jgi:hypothetical protein